MSFDNYPVEMERARSAVRSDPTGLHVDRTRASSDRMITLTLKEQPTVPLEAEVLSPDVMAPLDHDAIRALPVLLGKRQCRLDDFFDGRGRRPATSSRSAATSRKVKWIGRGMTRGRITIVGNAGMHLGAYMKGGTSRCPGTSRTGSAARCPAG